VWSTSNPEGSVIADSTLSNTDPNTYKRNFDKPVEFNWPTVYTAPVRALVFMVKSQHGRDCFITVLNQFRSRKVRSNALYS
jgi:hypothetical protein